MRRGPLAAPRLSVVAAILLAVVPALAQSPPLPITAESIAKDVDVTDGWRYRPGDDPSWADPALDDSSWEAIETSRIPRDRIPASGWTGIGWFRVHLPVAPDATKIPLALEIYMSGAMEVYLDGRLLQRFGVVGATPETEEVYGPRGTPVAIYFDTPGEHLLAVRYSNTIMDDRGGVVARWIARRGVNVGFFMQMRPHGELVREVEQRVRFSSGLQLGGVCINATLATLHLLLFAFYRRQRGNLYYGLFTLSLASAILFAFYRDNQHLGAIGLAVCVSAVSLLIPFSMASFLGFVHTAFSGGLPRYVKVLWPVWMLVIAIGIVAPEIGRETRYVSTGFSLLAGADALRVIFNAVRTGQDGARIVAVGILIFSTVLVRDALSNFVFLPEIVHLIVEPLSALGLALAVSIYLARGFARTNRDLEAQLAEVRRLATIEAEHERKTQELEEARQLQLSMLPATVPETPQLEIAAYMKPASEVGGDYYDFDVAEDGTLTVAVGDATGHGLKAGTMVTATKSLFKAFAREPHIPKIFSRSTLALKQLNLRYLYMGMLVLKVRENQLRVSTAGMPPMLIHRAATGTIEEIALKGMPLGSVANFPYQEREVTLEPGDTVVVMSDGFPERFNDLGEMLDYDRARAVLEESAGRSPAEIIEHFVLTGDAWANGAPQNDDVTFVVMKMKAVAGGES